MHLVLTIIFFADSTGQIKSFNLKPRKSKLGEKKLTLYHLESHAGFGMLVVADIDGNIISFRPDRWFYFMVSKC